ncbi:hypothetical protein QJS04_geneDACA025056 [Acorus gramineus]|uniref:Ribosome biogenesis regulatory protein n=1 Tax=Acorus gramineus TaxID=55184 RepID=A0AAV9A2D7_ACOGR|nr:hypothetical protein QJS04_geneDACA025056 [Acorus gramineus]
MLKSSDGAAMTMRRNRFTTSKLADMYTDKASGSSTNRAESNDEEMDIWKLLRDVQFVGSSSMSWKERKALENRNVVNLGGKTPKKHRVPLSVGKVAFKNRQQREHEKLQEEQILGLFKRNKSSRAVNRKPEERVLKTSEGHFKKGVLNVKHLLEPATTKGSELNRQKVSKGKRKGSGKKKGHKKRR